MTVADIKEKICNTMVRFEDLANRNKKVSANEVNLLLGKICSMLDELEPKAKWTNNMNGTFTCSRCGAKRPNDNYCGNCGARMNDEVGNGSAN